MKRQRGNSFTYKNKPFKKPRYTPSRQAALRRNRRSTGLIGLELKYFDCVRASVTSTILWASYNPSTGCTGSLSVPAQGDSASQRDGRKYKIHQLKLRGEVFKNSVESQMAPIQTEYIRIICYLDKQTNAAAATATDLMQTATIFSEKNIENDSRFTFLMDKIITVNPQAMSEGSANAFAGTGQALHWEFTKNFKTPILVNCGVGTTANVSAVVDKNIGVIAISSNGSVYLSYESRIRFTG